VKPSTIYQEFEKLAESLEVKIIQEKGNFKGGYCLLEKEKVIVINKLKPLEQRIKALALAFSRLDISNRCRRTPKRIFVRSFTFYIRSK